MPKIKRTQMKYLTPELVNEFSKLQIKITSKYNGCFYANYTNKQFLLMLNIDYIQLLKQNINKRRGTITYELIKYPTMKRYKSIYIAIIQYENRGAHFSLRKLFIKYNLRQRYINNSKPPIKNLLKI